MVISQPALVCLHVTVAHSTARATATSSRLLRLWARPARAQTTRQPLNPHTVLPDLPELQLRPAALRANAAEA